MELWKEKSKLFCKITEIPPHILRTKPVTELIQFWRVFQKKYLISVIPIFYFRGTKHYLLGKIALNYLVTPASAASCERLWSYAKDIMPPKRRTMKPWKAAMLFFLKFNIESINIILQSILTEGYKPRIVAG